MKSFKEWILEELEKGTCINTKYTYDMNTTYDLAEDISREIGRASCRERV